jgi:hypothetical protein
VIYRLVTAHRFDELEKRMNVAGEEGYSLVGDVKQAYAGFFFCTMEKPVEGFVGD